MANTANEYYEKLREDAKKIKFSKLESAYHHFMTPPIMLLNKKVTGGFEKTGYGKITYNAGFFKKLIAFFKGLFKSLPKVEVKP